jgi:hypothetical protein
LFKYFTGENRKMMRILKTFIFTIFIFNLAFSGGTSVALLWIEKNNQNEVQDISRHYVFPEVITHPKRQNISSIDRITAWADNYPVDVYFDKRFVREDQVQATNKYFKEQVKTQYPVNFKDISEIKKSELVEDFYNKYKNKLFYFCIDLMKLIISVDRLQTNNDIDTVIFADWSIPPQNGNFISEAEKYSVIKESEVPMYMMKANMYGSEFGFENGFHVLFRNENMIKALELFTDYAIIRLQGRLPYLTSRDTDNAIYDGLSTLFLFYYFINSDLISYTSYAMGWEQTEIKVNRQNLNDIGKLHKLMRTTFFQRIEWIEADWNPESTVYTAVERLKTPQDYNNMVFVPIIQVDGFDPASSHFS